MASHLPTSAADAGGNTLSYDYDAKGNLASTSALGAGQAGAPERYLDMDYNGPDDADPEGALRSVTDGEDNQTTFGYDSKGQLEAVTPPAGQDQTRYTYDALSRVKTVRDGNDNLQVLTCDALDCVREIVYQNPQGINASQVTSVYDQNGNLASRSDTTGTTTYAYDPRNAQTSHTLPGGRTTAYVYEQVGNLTSLSDAGGTVTYIYDKVNLLERLSEPAGTETAFEYDINNQRNLTVYPIGSPSGWITMTPSASRRSARGETVRTVRSSTSWTTTTATRCAQAPPPSAFRFSRSWARCCGGQHRPHHREACPIPSGQEAR